MDGPQFRGGEPEPHDATERTKNIMHAADIMRFHINKLPNSPERANALNRLEESVMWAIRAL